MSWSFEELQELLLEHGHHYLEGTSLPGVWANLAVRKVVNDHLWSWRRRETTIQAPGQIPELGQIEQVLLQDGTPLSPRVQANLRDHYDLTVEGTPLYYWRENKTIGVYPAAPLENLSVIHFTVFGWETSGGAPKMTADANGDVSIVPEEDQGVILAEMRALARSHSQDMDDAAAIRATEVEPALEQMRSDQRDQVDELLTIRRTTDDDC